MPDWQDVAQPPEPDAVKADALYLRPCDLFSGAAARAAIAAGAALPLAGGPIAFRRCELVVRGAAGVSSWRAPLAEIRDWAARPGGLVAARIEGLAANLTAKRPDFAGIKLNHPHLFGVLNTTPDSFSDGGDYAGPDAAIDRGHFLVNCGASVLDVGGESTRPGAAPVTVEEECRRVLPVIREIAARGGIVSIDSRHADVMAAALDAGARVLNDVTALTHEAASLPLASRRQAPSVLMHMQGEPGTMQKAPAYGDVVLDVFDYLEGRVAACGDAAMPRGDLCIDPGIGFGKTFSHNLKILEKLSIFHGLGTVMLVGVSRKSFLAKNRTNMPPKARLAASLAAGLAALNQGVQFLRVHDVPQSRQAIGVWASLVWGR